MNQRIQQLLATMGKQRALLHGIVEALSEEELCKSSSDESWSILEVIEHLTIVETATQSTVRKHIGEVQGMPTVSLPQRCRAWLLRLALKTPFRFKVPVKLVIPTGEVSVEELQASWSQLEQGWQTLLAELQGRELEVGIFAHPLAGWMNAEQTLEFITEHFSHHLPQLRRGLRQLERTDVLNTMQQQ